MTTSNRFIKLAEKALPKSFDELVTYHRHALPEVKTIHHRNAVIPELEQPLSDARTRSIAYVADLLDMQNHLRNERSFSVDYSVAVGVNAAGGYYDIATGARIPRVPELAVVILSSKKHDRGYAHQVQYDIKHGKCRYYSEIVFGLDDLLSRSESSLRALAGLPSVYQASESLESPASVAAIKAYLGEDTDMQVAIAKDAFGTISGFRGGSVSVNMKGIHVVPLGSHSIHSTLLDVYVPNELLIKTERTL